MMLRILLFFILFSKICFAQLDAKVSIASYKLEDYWVEELGPLNDLNEIVNYIHHDPYNFIFVESIPGGNPLAREISVNSFFGARSHPIHKVMKFHKGVDLRGVLGERVIASGHGKVIAAGFREDLGNFIKIQHKYGFESIYGHLSKISVKKGQEVVKGQNIGRVGATGKVTGPHLHYTLKKNQVFLDPFDFLFMSFEKAF
jgi:murein DD-endopeptidase MepM/ murein hydrolase activator NlpD